MTLVRRLRTQAGLTQQLLADRSGITQQTISWYETGKGSPTLRMLERLAESVGLRVVVSFEAPEPSEQPIAGEQRREAPVANAAHRDSQRHPRKDLWTI